MIEKSVIQETKNTDDYNNKNCNGDDNKKQIWDDDRNEDNINDSNSRYSALADNIRYNIF